jgi:hypothetical protein
MKKVMLVLMLGVFTFSMSSFKALDVPEQEVVAVGLSECYQQAIEVGEFMDGYNGLSGSYYTAQYIATFCQSR